MTNPESTDSPNRWENTDRDGTHWSVEIEPDAFNDEEGLIVSIWTENEDPEDEDPRPIQSLVMASAAQAREMAACLLVCADRVERAHKESANGL